MMIAQSAFLVQKDTLTPLIATVVGALVNIVGDVLLVSVLHQGVVGAAIATTLSQVASFLYLIYRVNQSVQMSCKQTNVSVRTYLQNRIKIPSMNDIFQFASFSGPLFAILLVKSFLWSFTTFACSTVGAVKLAAHQITLNGFIFLAIFGDVISQIAQTYLPSIFTLLESIREPETDEKVEIVKKEIPSISENIGQVTNNNNNNVNSAPSDTHRLSTLKQALETISKRVFNLSLGVASFTAVAALVMQTMGAKVMLFTSSILYYVITN
jgi:hypothetical protein